MDIDYKDRIVRDPKIAGGEAVIRGTRVTLRTLLASLAEGAATEEILHDFPTLTEQDVRAAIAFAAASAQVTATRGSPYQAVKIKLDENLPGRLVAALTDLGHDVDTVVHEPLAGVGDDAVWQTAQ